MSNRLRALKFKLTPPMIKRLAFAAMDTCDISGYSDISIHVTPNSITYIGWSERGQSSTTYASAKELDALTKQRKMKRIQEANRWA